MSNWFYALRMSFVLVQMSVRSRLSIYQVSVHMLAVAIRQGWAKLQPEQTPHVGLTRGWQDPAT